MCTTFNTVPDTKYTPKMFSALVNVYELVMTASGTQEALHANSRHDINSINRTNTGVILAQCPSHIMGSLKSFYMNIQE